jgi:hypothetical protein
MSFGHFHGDIPGGPAKLGEYGLLSFLLITLILNCNDYALLVNENSRIVQILQPIQALAMDEVSQEERLPSGSGCHDDK